MSHIAPCPPDLQTEPNTCVRVEMARSDEARFRFFVQKFLARMAKDGDGAFLIVKTVHANGAVAAKRVEFEDPRCAQRFLSAYRREFAAA